MKRIPLILFFILPCISFSQVQDRYTYEPSAENPFGKPNPAAPIEIQDFEPMIGLCECKSINRNPDGTWQDSVQMFWKFKYIMNGTAVQDETWKSDGSYTGSIRQFNADSAKWYVTFFSGSPVVPKPSTWSGAKEDDKIVLKLPRKAPNGFDGFSRLTFQDFTENGYNWIGEWVSVDGSITYPFWKIYCQRLAEE